MTPLWWTRLWVNTKKQSRDRTRDLPRTASWETLESCTEQPRFQFHPCLQSCDARHQIRCSQEWWHSQWFRGGPELERNTAPVLARSCNASTVLEYFKLFYCLYSLEKLTSVYFSNLSFIMCKYSLLLAIVIPVGFLKVFFEVNQPSKQIFRKTVIFHASQKMYHEAVPITLLFYFILWLSPIFLNSRRNSLVTVKQLSYWGAHDHEKETCLALLVT